MMIVFLAIFASVVAGFGPPPLPWGTILGESHGVIAYSNDGDKYPSWANATNVINYIGPYETGMRYQCVEYARRYLIMTANVTFESVDSAWNIWANVTHFSMLPGGESVPVVKNGNGVSLLRPVVGALLIWRRSDAAGWGAGHVAIVTAVDDTSVSITEQNYDDTQLWVGSRSSSRTLAVNRTEGGGYAVSSPEADPPLYGWVTWG